MFLNSFKKFTLIAILFLFFIIFTFANQAQAVAGVPKILNHQGRLLNSAGELLGGSSGTNYCFKFSIYDDATVGTPDNKLWPSGTSSTMTVNVKNGVFNVGIGATTTGGDLLDFDFQSNDTIFLNVEVASSLAGSCAGVSSFENLAPRQRIVSAGYSINASTVGGFTPSQSPTGNQIPVLTSGNLLFGGAVTIDSTGTAALNFGTGANAKTITIGNSAATTNLVFTKGASGNITFTGFTSCTALETDSSGNLACGADDVGAGGGGVSFVTMETPAGSYPVADNATDTLQFQVTGSNLTITGSSSTDSIAFDISESALAGAGLVVNSDALDIGAGFGITANANDIAIATSTNFTWGGTHTFNASTTFNATATITNLIVSGLTIGGPVITSATGALSSEQYLSVSRGGTGADLSGTGGANQFVKQSIQGGVLTVGAIADADVPDTITLTDITQITNRALSSLSGTLAIASTTGTLVTSQGGTGQNSSGWTGPVFVTAGTWGTSTIADSYVADDITLTNITQITNRALSSLTGTLAIASTTGTLTTSRGGTNQDSSGWTGLLRVTSGSWATTSLVDADVPDTITITNNATTGTALSVFSGTLAIASTTGTLVTSQGGTGQNSSGWTGLLRVTSGTWSTTTITGDDINSSIAGNGLVLTPASPDTLDVGAGFGITVNPDSIAISTSTNFIWGGTHTFNATTTLNTLVIGGDTFTDLTGTGLQASGTQLTASLGTSIETGEITDTTITGDDLNSNIAGGGLVLTAGSPDTLDVGAGAGISVGTDNVAVSLLTSADSAGASFSTSGLEFGGAGDNQLTLLQGCNANDVLKWSETNSRWECQADVSGGSPTLDSVAAAIADGAERNSGAYTVNWNWSFASSTEDTGLDISENVASSLGGQDQQALVEITTLSGSTASPLQITSNSADVGDIFINLANLGDFEIRDNGIAFATFADDGTITLGKPAAATTINIGTGTGVDTINIGTGATGADVITIGGNTGTVVIDGTNFDLATTGAITLTGHLTLSGDANEGLSGGGLADCDLTTQKLQWDSTTNKFSCGTDAGGGTTVVKKTADQVGTDTTLTTDTELLFPMGANSTWFFKYNLLVSNGNSAVPDWKSTIVAPAGSSCAAVQSGSEGAGAVFLQDKITDCTNATPVTMDNGAVSADASQDFNVYIQGWVTTVGTSGNVTMQFASFTTGANVTVRKGSIVTAYLVSGSDLAEIYYSRDEVLSPGTLLVIDPDITNGVKKSTTPYDKNILGVVSTKPGLVIGDTEGAESGSPTFVALSGRVLVRVSTENGPIQKGDMLTSSSIPGVAMKATKAGPIIGFALTSYEGEEIGTAIVFVNTTYSHGVELASLLPGLTAEGENSTTTDDVAKQILVQLINQKEQFTATSTLSEIFTDRLAAGLEIITPRIVAQGLVVESISALDKEIAFKDDVVFFGRPYFTTDTAGFAVVKAGGRKVDVVFEKEYIEQPVVNATISLEEDNDANDELIFANGINYIITKKSVNGFSIVVNKSAPKDIKFSWIALAVKNPKIFTSASIQTESTSPEPVLNEPVSSEPIPQTSLSEQPNEQSQEPLPQVDSILEPLPENSSPPVDSSLETQTISEQPAESTQPAEPPLTKSVSTELPSTELTPSTNND